MAPANLTRRRMIAIAAATAGSAFLAGGRRAAAGDAVRWRGSALGAQVSIDIFHPDREEAERIVQRCVLAEVRRLEQQFSLYRADSAICDPQPHRHSGRSGRRHGGAAQGLAAVFRPHRRRVRSDRPAAVAALRRTLLVGKAGSATGRRPQRLAEALAKVGRGGLRVSEDRVALAQAWRRDHAERHRPGLRHRPRRRDGCAQRGLSTTLVNMGEIRAIGARPDGTPWRVGLADPDRPGALTETVDLVDRAVATIGGRRLPLRLRRPVHASVRSRRRDAVPRSTGRSASLRRPPPRRMRFRPPSA